MEIEDGATARTGADLVVDTSAAPAETCVEQLAEFARSRFAL